MPKRNVVAMHGDGRLRLIEQDLPPVTKGTVLVEVHASLVSPGTEVDGWLSLSALRKNPGPPGEPAPFGYSNAGVVREVGDGAEEFSPGDRVACVGGGYALHADLAVVPHNLCVALPGGVTFAQGSYAMLLATATHALRRGEPELGETVIVVGMGILGLLTARLYQLAGNYAVGWDLIPFRAELARGWGIDLAVADGECDRVAETLAFTKGYGADAGVLAFGGEGDEAMRDLGKCMKRSPDGHAMGRIMVVGNPSFAYSSHEPLGMSNMDIRRASRTGFGYHDEEWEAGAPYPPVVMRWTTRTNLELCMRLVAEGKIDVDALTTHTIPLDRVDEGTSEALEEPERILGIVFVPASG